MRKGPMDLATLGQASVDGVMLGMMYILIALGLTLVYSILGIVNFAHAQFYMFGGFLTWLLFGERHLSYFLTLIIAMVVIGFFGVGVERLCFRPFRGKVLEAFIISLGLIWIFEQSVLRIMGVWEQGVPSAFPGKVEILGMKFYTERLVVTLIGVGLIVALHIFIKRTRYGRAMRAIAQDRECAALQGVNIDGTCSIAFGVGCALAAAAGVLLGPVLYISPYMGGPPILKAFIIIILGGLGSIPGCLLGGLFLGLIDAIGSSFISLQAVEVITFAFIFLMLLIRPRGLMGGLKAHE
jgi:branched-chain amino acid transport system permease protein